MDRDTIGNLDKFIRFVRGQEGFEYVFELTSKDRLYYRQGMAEAGVEMTPSEMDELFDLIIDVIDKFGDDYNLDQLTQWI
mgnify:CR=1 FL=1